MGRRAQVLADDGGEFLARQRLVAVPLALHAARPRRDPRGEDDAVHQRDPRDRRAVEEVRTQHDRAADVVADHGRRVEPQLVEELAQHRPVRRQADVLLDMPLGVPEPEQVEDDDTMLARELLGYLKPDEPTAWSPMDEHDRRPLAHDGEGDLPTARACSPVELQTHRHTLMRDRRASAR